MNADPSRTSRASANNAITCSPIFESFASSREEVTWQSARWRDAHSCHLLVEVRAPSAEVLAATAKELATQLVTANIAERQEEAVAAALESGKEMNAAMAAMLLAWGDVYREVDSEELWEEVIAELSQFVGTFCFMNAQLRGDITPLEYWQNIALRFADGKAD
jgi:uncharacterized protein (DUF58 family)